MRLIWTKSSLPLSVLIRWFLDSESSHFAIVFESQGGGLMFESNLLGTHPKFFRTALKHMTVVRERKINIPVDLENQIWDLIVDQVDGASYNYKGFAYFTWRAFLLKFFDEPLPLKNKWSEPGKFLCEQVFASFQGKLGVDLGRDLSMISPQQMYLLVDHILTQTGL